MTSFHFYLPLQIRYGDLDPQWHVNNAHTLMLIEQGRLAYLVKLGLFDGKDFFNLGLIVADVHVSYLAPILLEQNVQIGVRVARMGNKSLTFEYLIEERDTGQALARAETVMVSYDYPSHHSRVLPADWRAKIAAFDEMEL